MGQHMSGMDASVKAGPVTTIVIAVCLAGLGIYPFLRHFGEPGFQDLTLYLATRSEKFIIYLFVTPLILLFWLFMSYQNRVRSISVSSSRLIIERKRKPIVIDMNEIASIEWLKSKELRFAQYDEPAWKRSLVGAYGKYYKKQYGIMTWYCTKGTGHVMVTMKDGKKMVVTPDDPEVFVNDIGILNPGVNVG